MALSHDARRPTRLLVFVMTIVAARFAELRTGWPDAVVLPLVALLSLAAFEFGALPEEHRMGAHDWVLNGVFAVLVGGLLWLLGG